MDDISLKKKVLIVTLTMNHGGTGTMTRLVIDFLRERNYEVAVAHYMPYLWAKELSVPLWQLVYKRPSYRETTILGDVKCYQVGVRLPELEWARYVNSRLWSEVLDGYDFHMVVSGNVLPLQAILASGRECLAWIATPYLEDKLDRLKSYSRTRRLFDYIFDKPLSMLLEKKALSASNVMPMSEYTQQDFARKVPAKSFVKMPMPIDTMMFEAKDFSGFSYHIGFAGRFDDPRKNIGLLFNAVKLCRVGGLKLELDLIGADPTSDMVDEIKRLDLENFVNFLGSCERTDLPKFYQSIDLFVLPSTQEGLAIVGLEAMACGKPVISTRCGGPEEYIKDYGNGVLVDSNASDMAAAIQDVYSDEARYTSMSKMAKKTIEPDYSMEKVKNIFWREFNRTYHIKD